MKMIPYRPMALSKWADELFENFLRNPAFGFDSPEVMFQTPSVNIREEDASFFIEVAAPGLQKEDFHLEIENGYLKIWAQKESKEEQNEERFMRREFNFTRFERSFRLPDVVDANAISARYENGILLIGLPKLESARKESVKTIEIK